MISLRASSLDIILRLVYANKYKHVVASMGSRSKLLAMLNGLLSPSSSQVAVFAVRHMHWKYPLHLSYRILLRQTLSHVRVLTSVRSMSRKPQIISSEELPVSEAKWVTLKRIKFSDQEGREVCMFISVTATVLKCCSVTAIVGSCREKNARLLWH